MKTFTLLITTTTALLTFSTYAADDATTARERRQRAERRGAPADIDRLVREINVLDNKPAAKRAGLAAISKETSIPLNKIEDARADHPTVGLAGLFMAHELSARTKKPVNQFIQEQQTGKSWTELARANRQDLATIEDKLARIQQAMENPEAVAANNNEERNRNRDRAARRGPPSEIEKSVEAINALDHNPAAMRAGLSAISKETAVPLPTLEEQQRRNPNVGLGDLFFAQDLAVQTQKSVDEMLKLHSSGRTWNEIALMNNKDLANVQAKLDRIEDAMQPGAAVPAPDDRTRVRDRRDRRAPLNELERRIAAINTLDDQPQAMRAGLTASSKETAMPLPTVERNQRQNANVGLGDFFVAQELSIKTQKSVDELLRLHASGKTWNEIATTSNQDMESIQRKLANVEQAMRDAVK